MTQKVPLVEDRILLQVCINPEAVMLEDTEIQKGKFKENEKLPVNQLESVSEDSSKGWSHEMICLLLASMSANYQNYCNQLTRDMAYRAIIEKFKSHGYELNKNPIKKKWNSLLTTYRRTRDRLKSNGESKQTWVYYDHIDEIVQKSSKETSPPPIGNVESYHFEESDEKSDDQTHKSSFDIEPIGIKSEIQELEEENEDKSIFTEEHEKNIYKEASGLATSSLFIKEDISRNEDLKRKNNNKNEPVRKKRKTRKDEITLNELFEFQKESAKQLNATINLAADTICKSLQSLKTDIVNAILQKKS